MSRCAPRTLAISQRRTEHGEDVVAWARATAAAGVDAIQLREKDLGARRLLELARRSIESVPASVMVLINGRLDVAIASGAAGAHCRRTVCRSPARDDVGPTWFSASPPIVATRSPPRATPAPTTSYSAPCSLRSARTRLSRPWASRSWRGCRRSASRCSRSAASPSSGCPRSPPPAPRVWPPSAPSSRRTTPRAFVAAAHRLFPPSPVRGAARSEAMAP